MDNLMDLETMIPIKAKEALQEAMEAQPEIVGMAFIAFRNKETGAIQFAEQKSETILVVVAHDRKNDGVHGSMTAVNAKGRDALLVLDGVKRVLEIPNSYLMLLMMNRNHTQRGDDHENTGH